MQQQKQLTELEAVNSFYRKSKHLSHMSDYLSSDTGQEHDKHAVIQALKRASTFAEMLVCIDSFDGLHQEPQLFQTVFKTMIFFGSYVNPAIDFRHNLLKLRDEIHAYALANNYALALPEKMMARL